MAMGLGIGIGIPSGALNSNRISSLIPGLILTLCERSTYCENKTCTTAILEKLENIKS
jgi:hypothetical protein